MLDIGKEKEMNFPWILKDPGSRIRPIVQYSNAVPVCQTNVIFNPFKTQSTNSNLHFAGQEIT